MKYIAIIKTQIYKYKIYTNVYLFNSIFIFINTIIQILIYNVFFESSNDKELWQLTIVYLIMGRILGEISSLYRVPEFSENIYNGNFVKYSVRPIKYWIKFFLMEVGESILSVILVIPLIVTAIIFIVVNNINVNIIAFILSLILAVTLSILLTNAIYSLTQITLKNGAPRALLQSISSLLSGSLVPLILWPSQFEVIKYLPFALIINAPIEILLGEKNLIQILSIQCLWILLFLIINSSLCEKTLSKQYHLGG